ncbi:MAG: NAD-dependent epimerase/dehydratase family protein [Endomicrobiia bacterium]
MKVLITGGAGFIGSHLTDECLRKGWDVVVVDNLSTGKQKNVNKNAKFYMVDITDLGTLRDIFKKEKPQIVSHHAAQIDVRKSVSNPQYDATVNIIGSLNLLQLSVEYKVKKFIFASSGGTIYGECKNKTAPKETSRMSPESPYGCAKSSVELYLWYYYKVYGLNAISLRYANVYGPRQDPKGEAGVVAIFIDKMLNNQDVYIYGDGNQMRDFVYVKDVVDANIKSMLSKKEFGIFNVATGKSISINKIFNLLSKFLEYHKPPIYKPSRPGEIFRSCLNIELIKKELKWKPRFSIVDGLKETVLYFKNQFSINGKIQNYK